VTTITQWRKRGDARTQEKRVAWNRNHPHIKRYNIHKIIVFQQQKKLVFHIM